MVHIALSFYVTTKHQLSLIGPIFSLVGLLVGIGILGSYKRDHTMTCVVSFVVLKISYSGGRAMPDSVHIIRGGESEKQQEKE